MTPLSSVAMLEKLALLNIASCNAPAFRSVSSLRTSVNFSVSASRTDSSCIGIVWEVLRRLVSQILSHNRRYFTEVNRLCHEWKASDPPPSRRHCFLGRCGGEEHYRHRFHPGVCSESLCQLNAV